MPFHVDAVARRFIPAYAGNTHRADIRIHERAVHPRVCGEHTEWTMPERLSFGSSPRMRGTPTPFYGPSQIRRFIPAYAGNTNCDTSRPATYAVHPRVCGEHSENPRLQCSEHGSSPRMRGTRREPLLDDVNPRFIPAYAGNTPPYPPVTPNSSVHPRVCGEHDLLPDRNPHSSGSSPRMRGTRSKPTLTHGFTRFIPAYAGNTKRHWLKSHTLPVHPRVCGEHYGGNVDFSNADGSSPRMRGTQAFRPTAPEQNRFIPAYAGNTPRGSRTSIAPAVHPRVCGEHICRKDASQRKFGSSPRMRGTPCPSVHFLSGHRFIPAYAGNTTHGLSPP